MIFSLSSSKFLLDCSQIWMLQALGWQHPKRHLSPHTAGEACNLRLLRNQLSQKKK